MSGLRMKYFVLKPKGDDIYAEASRKAMRTYAAHIYNENPQFANDLLEWAKTEGEKTGRYEEHGRDK
jgi:hypothetical protein